MMSLSDVKTVLDNYWQGFVVSSSIRKFVLGNCTSISLRFYNISTDIVFTAEPQLSKSNRQKRGV